MSTTVDNRVVEMQFDNSRFEKNVSTSMSTLDKLKQSLNFTGASKGLENVQAAAKNVNMAGLGSAVESVQAKFSAMQVVGMTALANITNSAVNAGKRLVSAFTIDPIKTGFSEYEMKMDSVKTIMASTGESVEKVNGYLEELNAYSDQTIYSFSDMTQNIGKFTNAGVKLEDAVLAIQGISNEAAVSGANANEASRAMYNFAQALSAGYVKLIDWKSIENANMATVEFKQQLIDSAVAAGQLTKGADGMYTTLSGKTLNATKNFNDTLQEQWMTSEVLINTLKNYADNTTEIGKKAFAAAQDVTKFTQMMDVLKETAQSGWAKTWEIIFGDIEKAKAVFTPLTNFFSGVIDKMSDARNKLLESALGKSFVSTFNALSKGLNGVKEKISGITEPIKTVTKTLEDYQNVVKEVIRGGKWGHTQERWDALTKAGYDWATVQNMVNEQLGCSKRHATDFVIGQDKVTESTEESVDANKKYIAELAKKEDWELRLLGLNELQIKTIRDLQKEADKLGLSTEEFLANIDNIDGRWVVLESLKNIGSGIVGIFKAMAAAWREIFDPMTGDQLYNIIAAFHKFSLNLRLTDKETGELTETGLKFQKIFKGVFAILNIITTLVGGGLKIAFKVVSALFDYFGMSVLDAAVWIAEAAVKLSDWINSLLDFKKIIGKIAKPISEAAAAIKEWVAANVDFENISKRINGIFKSIGDAFKEFFAIFNGDRAVVDPKKLADSIVKAFGALFDAIGEIFDKLTKDMQEGGGEAAGGFVIGFASRLWSGIKYIGEVLWNIGKIAMSNLMESLDPDSPLRKALEMGGNIVQGLAQGITEWAPKAWEAIVGFAKTIIDKFCEITGIASPSKVFLALGGFIIAGLLLGIQEGFITVPESLQGIVDKCLEVIKNIDWGAVFAAGSIVAGLLIFKKLTDILENFSAPFGALGEVFEETKEAIQSFSKVTKAMATNLKAEALKKMAISLAILVASVVAIVYLCGDDYGKMWNAVGIIVVLAGVLVGLAWAMSLISDASISFEKGKGFNIDGIRNGLLTIAVAIGILALVVKMLGSMNATQAKQGFEGLAGIAAGMVVFFAAIQGLSLITKGEIGDGIDKVGSMMIKISIAMLLMVGVCKLAGKMKMAELAKGIGFMGAFALFTVALTLIGKDANDNIGKVGGMMIKISLAMLLMLGVCKLASKLKVGELLKATVFALAFVGFVKLLIMATQIGSDKQIAKLGGMLFAISASMLMMIGVCKLVSKLSTEDMIKGGIFALAFAVFVGLLVKITSIASDKQVAKASGTIIAISVAIGVMALVASLLSFMSIEGLVKGVAAVGVLSLMMALMIKSLKGAQNVMKSLIVMTVAIAVMAGAVALLSMIDPAKLATSAAGLALLMGMFALIVRSMQTLKGVEKIAGKLVIMTLVIAALAGILWALSKLDAKSSLGNVTSLVILMAAMSGLMIILSKMKLSTASAVKGIALLTAMVIPMMAFVAVLHFMPDITQAKDKIIMLTAVMLAMTALLVPLALIGNFGLQAIIGVGLLTAMVVPMMAFVAVLYYMPDITKAKNNIILLTGVMIVMTALLAVLSVIGWLAIGALGGILGLTAMVIPMWVFAKVMSTLPDITKAANNIALLVNVMNVMTIMLTKLAIVGPLALIGVAAMGALVLLMGAIGILAVAIGWLMEKCPDIEDFLNKGLPILELLAGSIGTMIGKFIGGIGEGLGDSLVKIGEDIAEFMESIAKASETAKGIDGAAFDGLKQLVEALVAVGLTSMGMSIAGTFTKVLTGGKEGKTSMQKFEEDGIAFFEAMKGIAEAANGVSIPTFNVAGFKSLLEAIAAIGLMSVGTSLADVFTKAFTGGKDSGQTAMQKFEEDGKAFFKAISAISAEMSGFALPENFNSEDLTKFLGILKSVSSQMVGNSFGSMFTIGGSTIDRFKTDGVAFFEAISAINEKMTGFKLPDDFNSGHLTKFLGIMKSISKQMVENQFGSMFVIGGSTIDSFKTEGIKFFEAISAIKETMTGFKLPDDFNSGHLTKFLDALKAVGEYTVDQTWNDIFTLGGTSIEKFTTDGTGLFGAISAIAESAAGITLDSFGNAELAIERIKSIIASVNGIDYSGVETFTGIGTGGIGADGPMHKIASAIKDFGDTIKNVDTTAISTGATVASKIKTLISDLVGLDTSGIENFKAKEIGTAMKGYNSEVKDIKTDIVASSIVSANKIITLIRSLVSLDNSGVTTFNPRPIASKLSTYYNTVAEIDFATITASISVANKLKNFIISLASIDSSGVSAFVSAVDELGTVQVDKIVAAFSGSASKLSSAGGQLIDNISKGMKSRQISLTVAVGTIIKSVTDTVQKSESKFQPMGVNLMTNLIKGIGSKRSDVISAVESITTPMVSSIRNKYLGFYAAGSYLVDGFKAGISENSYKAAAQAAAMATAAEQAAKEALGIHSPSKIFYKIGAFTGQGFINALGDYGDKSYDAGSGIADSARSGLTAAISKIRDAINGDLDMQPTIAPVLDLSNVKSGAGAISGMFGTQLSVGAIGNVNAVSSLMNRNIQNGGNDDIISAIDKLNKNLSNVGGTSYNINGITYDDGSNIASAINTLVRATTVEGRI